MLNLYFDCNPHPRNLIFNDTIFICHFFFENWSDILAGSRVGGIFLHCTHLDEMHIFIVFAICIIYEIAQQRLSDENNLDWNIPGNCKLT